MHHSIFLSATLDTGSKKATKRGFNLTLKTADFCRPSTDILLLLLLLPPPFLPRLLSFSRMSMPNSENASTLENAMQLMIQTFHKYSGNEGDKYTLSRAELKEMLTAELGNYLGNAQDREAVDKVMGDLDSNNDGEVDFTEFIILVGALTVACNDFFLEYNDKPEKK
uniref:S100 calcium binding protein T n=2 Tax=Labrus bergylta TaxID=56723 RepID=A0A3Q3LD95_9LABR